MSLTAMLRHWRGEAPRGLYARMARIWEVIGGLMGARPPAWGDSSLSEPDGETPCRALSYRMRSRHRGGRDPYPLCVCGPGFTAGVRHRHPVLPRCRRLAPPLHSFRDDAHA